VLDPPGFWRGLLHGFTILFSLIASIFTDHRIYAYPNAGGWYDLGFFLGASAFLGGSMNAEMNRERRIEADSASGSGKGDKGDVSGQPGPD
jgi:hypothetical protein